MSGTIKRTGGVASLGLLAWCLVVPLRFASAEAQPIAGAVHAARDREAAATFRQGQYAEALALYEALARETQHPIYLRNLGRCHQMLRQPDQAIHRFQQYLQTSPDVSEKERQEIRGYIAEMESLRAGAKPDSESGQPAAVPPIARLRPQEEVPATAPPVAAKPSSGWWWGGGVMVVVLGVIATTLLLTASGNDRPSCPEGWICGG